LLRANVAGTYDVESGQIVGLVIGESEPGGIEHLQKEIPDEAVGFFDFVEQKDALPMLGKHFSQATGAAGLVAQKQLDVVEVEEFGHVEPEHGILAEKVAGEFQGQFCLPHPGWSEKKKRTERLALRLQSELAAFQHGADTGNGMILAFDFGKQMGFRAGNTLNKTYQGLGILKRELDPVSLRIVSFSACQALPPEGILLLPFRQEQYAFRIYIRFFLTAEQYHDTSCLIPKG